MPLPNPDALHPITLPDGSPHTGTVMLARAVAAHPRWQVGAYTYASDLNVPQDWASHLAPYLYPWSGERLEIGRFCQIAHGVRLITASANHDMTALTCYPFPIFDPEQMADYKPDQRDTIIGHDVWIGTGAMVLPGARIGHGAIIGAGAVVRGEIPPYAVATGNPAEPRRFRFGPDQITALLELEWWSWSPARLQRAEKALLSGDPDALRAFAPD